MMHIVQTPRQSHIPKCPYCDSELWETNGNVDFAEMLVRKCFDCGEEYADEATQEEKREFKNRKTKEPTIWKSKKTL